MLRIVFVCGIILIGAFASLQGPFYALLFYLWNAYFRPEYWIWDDFLLSLRLSLTIGLILLVGSLGHLQNFRWNRQLILVAAFFGQATLSLLTSQFIVDCWPFWLEFLKIIVVSMLMTVLVNTRDRFRITLWMIAWSLSFEGAKQGWAQLVTNPGATNINPHVMLGDNNGVAMGMMMLVPMLLALAQTSTTIWERNLHYFVLVGVAYRGISTYSRGGFIAGAIVFVLSLARSQHRFRTLIWTTLVLSALLSVMPDRFWERMESITASTQESGRDASAQSRIEYWSHAIDMSLDYPINGVGFNGYRYALPRYDSTGQGQRAVHSIWFATLADMGYPGLLLFLSIAVSTFLACQRIRSTAMAAGHRDIALYASHLQTAVAVYCVAGSFLSAQYLELWWHVVALCATLSLVAAQEPVTARLPAEAPVVDPVSSMPVIPARLRR